MDVISRIFNWLFDGAGALSSSHLSFLFRALLVLILPCFFCSIAFAKGNRSVMIQVFCMMLGVLLAATIPVHSIAAHITHRIVKAWVVTLGVVLLIFLPGILPVLVTPRLGLQRTLRTGFYLGLILLFLIHLIQNGCK